MPSPTWRLSPRSKKRQWQDLGNAWTSSLKPFLQQNTTVRACFSELQLEWDSCSKKLLIIYIIIEESKVIFLILIHFKLFLTFHAQRSKLMTEELQDIMNTNTFLKSIIFRSVTLCVCVVGIFNGYNVWFLKMRISRQRCRNALKVMYLILSSMCCGLSLRKSIQLHWCWIMDADFAVQAFKRQKGRSASQ